MPGNARLAERWYRTAATRVNANSGNSISINSAPRQQNFVQRQRNHQRGQTHALAAPIVNEYLRPSAATCCEKIALINAGTAFYALYPAPNNGSSGKQQCSGRGGEQYPRKSAALRQTNCVPSNRRAIPAASSGKPVQTSVVVSRPVWAVEKTCRTDCLQQRRSAGKCYARSVVAIIKNTAIGKAPCLPRGEKGCHRFLISSGEAIP